MIGLDQTYIQSKHCPDLSKIPDGSSQSGRSCADAQLPVGPP